VFSIGIADGRLRRTVGILGGAACAAEILGAAVTGRTAAVWTKPTRSASWSVAGLIRPAGFGSS